MSLLEEETFLQDMIVNNDCMLVTKERLEKVHLSAWLYNAIDKETGYCCDIQYLPQKIITRIMTDNSLSEHTIF